MNKHSESRAFTLIEVLVVIGIIGILLAILTPALAGAKTSAAQVASLANTKSISDSFTLVEGETGAYPTKEIIGPLEGMGGAVFHSETPLISLESRRTTTDGTEVMLALVPVWELAALWPLVMSEHLDVVEHQESWFSPGRPVTSPTFELGGQGGPDEGITPPVSYRYSNSFLAKPSLWDEGRTSGGLDPKDVVTGVLAADVQRPAVKALVWDADLAYLPVAPKIRNGHYDAPAPMAFADGHSDLKNPAEAREGAPNPLNGGATTRLHNTAGGVLGADY